MMLPFVIRGREDFRIRKGLNVINCPSSGAKWTSNFFLLQPDSSSAFISALNPAMKGGLDVITREES